ncbi:MAG: 30S ribosomal protein S12 methylthiotransferase RimO [Candidatus Krumholzibacteria bacterium]
MRTYMTSMGCPKNLVDTEACLSLLRGVGCTITANPEDAELLIVNACSFLDAAWQETVEEVHRLAGFKRECASKKLILTGCLPRHRAEDLRATLPEVDQFLPPGAQGRLASLVSTWCGEAGTTGAASPVHTDPFAGFEQRRLLTPGHTAYVKIAEGCSRDCTFCAIPTIRGGMVSRKPDSVVREVENLVAAGVREIALLAQDITSYYADGTRLSDLVDAIVRTGIDWVRILYVHPGSLTPALARRLFSHTAVCRYLECPVQHASDRVLKRMRRPYSRERLETVFGAIREEFPDVRLRSEVIVGFPGEDEDDFDTLKRFVESMEFSSLGIFTYSPEPGTPAAGMDGQVTAAVKAERAAELATVQDASAFGLYGRERHRVHRVLVDRRLEEPAPVYPDCAYAGRYYGQAFEVDGEVFLTGDDIAVGDFVDVRIIDSDITDLKGEVL